jgi:hypothetical protein
MCSMSTSSLTGLNRTSVMPIASARARSSIDAVAVRPMIGTAQPFSRIRLAVSYPSMPAIGKSKISKSYRRSLPALRAASTKRIARQTSRAQSQGSARMTGATARIPLEGCEHVRSGADGLAVEQVVRQHSFHHTARHTAPYPQSSAQSTGVTQRIAAELARHRSTYRLRGECAAGAVSASGEPTAQRL